MNITTEVKNAMDAAKPVKAAIEALISEKLPDAKKRHASRNWWECWTVFIEDGTTGYVGNVKVAIPEGQGERFEALLREAGYEVRVGSTLLEVATDFWPYGPLETCKRMQYDRQAIPARIKKF